LHIGPELDKEQNVRRHVQNTHVVLSIRVAEMPVNEHKNAKRLPDIKPQTPIKTLARAEFGDVNEAFPIEQVAVAVGMQVSFIRKIIGRSNFVTAPELLCLLDQDAFAETLVPRSMVLEFLRRTPPANRNKVLSLDGDYALIHGNVLTELSQIERGSVRCIVTSTPYWGLRVYKDSHFTDWADGAHCPYGHEQTPESFLRHTTEVLAALYDVLADNGSIWWNLLDTFNTRTQIRSNAAEALRAMQGQDGKSWGDHECRRYSAGHSYLKDGEQCLIPTLVAKRASQIGYFVKTVVTWAKTSSLPEPQESRVSKNLEYVLHLTKTRTPLFQKEPYRSLPPVLGGRNVAWETDKLSDVWTLPTSSGRDGHGAQFPIALPGRCIAISTSPGDIVLDPFVGAGNAGVAALALGRKFIGIDVSKEYLETAKRRIRDADRTPIESPAKKISPPAASGTLL
jgi:DNA modification methylase